MMMRSIRANTKWIMLGLSLAFAAWLVFDWVQSRDTAAAVGLNPVIAVVNGEEIRYARWSAELEAALARARGTTDAPLTDEESRQVERQAWDAMIDNILIEQEIARLGIRVTDAEVRQAFRLNPPAELMQYPAFQTNGRFDYQKYEQFFADPTVDEQLLLQIEAYYRTVLPRARLSQQLGQGGAVSDARLWQEFRTRNETATVTFLSVDQGADPEPPQVDQDRLRKYYRENLGDFDRPATATIHIVSFPTTPSRRDTAAARAQGDSLRASILAGELSFEEAAAAVSADAATAAAGGDLGRFGRGQLLPALEEAAFALSSDQVSEPVLSTRGYHILRVSERTSDSVSVQHILLPVRLTPESEDELFDRMDDLEGIALTEGLESAADSLQIPIGRAVTVTEGFDFVPGAGALGVAVDWALDPATPLNEVSEFFRNASGYHIIEVLDRAPGGKFAFEEVRDQIRQILAERDRRERTRRRAADAMEAIRRAPSLEVAAAELGFPVDTVGPFGRREFVPGLGRDTEAIGAAFGAPVGQIAGPYVADDVAVVLRVDERVEADPALFESVKEQIRAQLVLQAGQVNVSRWIEGLRETADIVDRRDRLSQQTASS